MARELWLSAIFKASTPNQGFRRLT